jgi:DNA-binding CsgD family transcriptional regulator
MTAGAEEYEERLTIIGALRWFRDSFASWFATGWLYIILWAVVGIAFTVLLYIDGKFSRSLAEGLEDIDPFSFQAMGWGFRLFAAIFLMAAARCIYKSVKGALTFRLLGGFASVIVCLHAFGFGFQALQDRRDDAMAVREVVALQANNSDEQIALLREQIETTRADRDARVTRLQASIDGIVSDGLNNDQLADVYRADQTKAENDATAKINAAEAEISRLAGEGNAAQQTIATVTADEKPWPALYIGLAQLLTWSKEPDDWAIYLCGVGFIVLWVLLAEALVIFLPERIYLMHLRDAEARPKAVEAKDGEVIIKMTEQEAQEMQDALRHYAKLREGHVRGGETKSRKSRQDTKRIEANQYMEARKDRVTRMRLTGASVAEIARKLGVTPSVLALEMRQWMNDPEYSFVFMNGPNPYGDDQNENLDTGT